LFVQKAGRWVMLRANQPLTARELRAGLNLRLEALDIVRDKRHWDGNIDVIAKVTNGKKTVVDRVRFHVAPLIVQSDLMRVQQLYLPGMPWGQDDPSGITGVAGNAALSPIISRPSAKPVFGYLSILDAANPGAGILGQSSVASAEKLGLLGSAFKAFHDDFVTAGSALRPPARIIDLSTFEDPWVQDMYEMAFAAMPKPEGKVQIMHIALRSPQPQRWTAQLPLVELLGPNVGIVEQWADDSGFAPNSGEYSSNSTGNFGTIPPYSYKGINYPLGRVLFGAGKAWMQTGGGIIDSSLPGSGEFVLTDRFPDKTFVKMLTDQGLQKPVIIDTAWLAVGHIDEVVAFVPADNRRGWKVVVADPVGAWKLLTDMVKKGLGATKFLSGLEPWAIGIPVELLDRTVLDVVNDTKIAAAQRTVQTKIASVINVLKRETGVDEGDIIRVPVVFEPTFFNEQSFTALTPNAANLVALGQNKVAVARQHGPLAVGVDVFEKAVASALRAVDLSVFWVEDYIQAHGGSGEIHCQSNTLRNPGRLARWWKRGHRTKHNEE
jgi:protein-arginine deiminase